MSLPQPSALVGLKLANIAIHAQEAIGPGGHEFDAATIRTLLSDPELRAYLETLDALALLPVMRDEGAHRGR